MRKAWVIAIFSLTCVITAIVVAFSLTCNVKSISVNVLTGGYTADAVASAKASTQDLFGSSIFLLDEDEIAAKIESDYAKQHTDDQSRVGIEVLGVERVFPSTVNVYVATKYAHACIALGQGYAVVDNDMRVLYVMREKPDLTEIVSTPKVTVTSAVAGEIIALSDPRVATVADAVYYELAALGYDVFNGQELVETLSIDLATDTVTVCTSAPDGNGSEIVIKGTADLGGKLRLGISVYVASDENKTAHRITVSTKDGKNVALLGDLA